MRVSKVLINCNYYNNYIVIVFLAKRCEKPDLTNRIVSFTTNPYFTNGAIITDYDAYTFGPSMTYTCTSGNWDHHEGEKQGIR